MDLLTFRNFISVYKMPKKYNVSLQQLGLPLSRVRDAACPAPSSDKQYKYGVLRDGIILCDGNSFQTPSGFSTWFRRSLPGRRNYKNTSNGWADVEVEINNVWVPLIILRDRFLATVPSDKVDVSTNELRLLSF